MFSSWPLLFCRPSARRRSLAGSGSATPASRRRVLSDHEHPAQCGVGDVDQRVVRDVGHPVLSRASTLTIAICRLVSHCCAVIRDGSMERPPTWNWFRSSVPLTTGASPMWCRSSASFGATVRHSCPERDPDCGKFSQSRFRSIRVGVVLWRMFGLGAVRVVHRDHDDGELVADQLRGRVAGREQAEDLQRCLGAVQLVAVDARCSQNTVGPVPTVA